MTILSGFKIISQQIYQCNFSSQHAQPPMTNLQWKNVDSCTGVRIKNGKICFLAGNRRWIMLEVCLIVMNSRYKTVSFKDNLSRWMAVCVHCEVMLIEWPGITFKNLKVNNWKTIKEATTIRKFQGCQLAQKVGLKLHETQLFFHPEFHTRELKKECFVYFSRTINHYS